MKKITTICIAAVIILIVAISIFQHCRHDTWLKNREVITHQVTYGDTLYDLAQEYKPSWMDIREWCYEVCRLNDMECSDLYAGQTIKIYAIGGN